MDRAEYLTFAHVCIRQVETLYLLADLDRVPPLPLVSEDAGIPSGFGIQVPKDLRIWTVVGPRLCQGTVLFAQELDLGNGPSQSTKGCGSDR